MTDATAAADRNTLVDTVFRRLFENEFATLDGIAISHSIDGELEYIDESVALGRMLDIESAFAPFEPTDVDARQLHQAMHDAWPEVTSVVSGWSRHLKALFDEDMALPACTSMMRKRGVSDLAQYVVDPSALKGVALEATLASARATAQHNEMAHVLVVVDNGMVVVAGPTAIEAMAHWHNVEFAARIECMRVEEVDVNLS
jgi:hypothetical protein